MVVRFTSLVNSLHSKNFAEGYNDAAFYPIGSIAYP